MYSPEPVTLLRELVMLPSVNPMGQDLPGEIVGEHRVTAYIVRLLRAAGVEFERHVVHPAANGLPARENILARYTAGSDAKTVLLDAHMDTVPINGMSIDPFGGELRDGRVYGRGSCDVKAGLAAMLAAFLRIVREKPATACNVVLSCTCDEEFQATGAVFLATLWGKRAGASKIISKRPDFVVVAEPTLLNVVVAHRGAIRWKIRTRGRACHSSTPHLGVNAIYSMAEVLQALERYAGELATRTAHRLVGPPSLSVGVISGGSSVNVVPDSCEIEIDRRLIPGEDPKTIIPDVEQYLRQRLDVDFDSLPPSIESPPLSDGLNTDWGNQVLATAREFNLASERIGVPYGTNASRIAATGVSAVVCGPGDIAQAHTHDEWVAVDEVNRAAEFYYRLCN